MDVIDIALIGSGISTTVTLIELFNKLLNEAPAGRKMTITVIEKNNEFWKGIPYGARSSVNALTITSVQDFIYEQERPRFFKWLKAGKAGWSAYYREHGGEIAGRWLDKNLPLIESEDWQSVYIPRFLFGNYLSEKLAGLREAVQEKQLADIRLLKAEAINVKVTREGLHEITLEHPGGTLSKIISRKLVVAPGSAPVKRMCDITGEKALYINDIYEPGVTAHIKMLQTALNGAEDSGDRNVLIIGSNASSLELLYLMEGMPQLRKLVNKTVIISTSGLLPHSVSTEALDGHPTPHLDELKAKGGYNIAVLADAAALDVSLALQGGANMAYIGTIINHTLTLMEDLGEDAKRAFYAIHGIRLRDMFRRAGPEYKNASQLLIDLQQVTIIKGRFLSARPSEKGVLLDYLDAATGQQLTHPLTFKAVINCSGSDNLDQSSSRLLNNLVNKGICQMNLSGKGIEVNERFEAAPNLYVIGPLLAGNVNKLIHFWQLENASRLTYLAPFLAAELLKKSKKKTTFESDKREAQPYLESLPRSGRC